MSDDRIVKIPLPLSLIRQMDDLLVAGIGGYQSRTHFIRDAIESFVLELRYPEAPPEPMRSDPAQAQRSVATLDPDWSLTVLEAPSADMTTMDDGEALVPATPMFGLHNRDYPSLWLAAQLCKATKSGPVNLESFLDSATQAAWAFVEPFTTAASNGIKAAALFPTNPKKRQSSEQAFRAFAFGVVSTSKSGELNATGPLFQWRVCQAKSFARGKTGVAIAITTDGADLLRSLDGISMRVPHEHIFADRFLTYLAANAPADWKAFVQVLRLVADQPTRTQLLSAFHRHYTNWTPIHAATNAAGYVARGREWGFIEPKLNHGSYALTAYGDAYIRKANP